MSVPAEDVIKSPPLSKDREIILIFANPLVRDEFGVMLGIWPAEGLEEVAVKENHMGNIPVSGKGSEAHIRWEKGRKVVTTDGGRRVDVYQDGNGKPDGPGHDHLWATFDKNGNQTSSGGRVK